MSSRRRRRGPLLGLALLLATACAAKQTEVGGVALALGSDARELDPAEVAQRGAAAVGVITTDVSRGLAFVVDPEGYLITSRHVIEDGDHVEKISFPGLNPPREFRSIKIVYIDPLRDLALLRIEADEPLPFLELATDSAAPVETYLKAADRVLLLARGEDKDETFIAHAGRVDDLQVFNPALGDGAFVGLTNDVRQGQSGGPVLDRYGRAVGIVTWTWRHRVGGYAIPIAEATRMLHERPKLDMAGEQEARAKARATKFVDAVYAGHLEQARRMLSPTYARSVREETMDRITASVSGPGSEAVGFFFAALEDLVGELEDGREAEQMENFREMVMRTGSRQFRDSLGVGDEIGGELVVSFFFELGKAYMSARYWGEMEPEEAIETALFNLRTLDAARTFAFASLTATLEEGPAEITKIEVLPGVYAPKAVVTLRSPGRPGSMVMQLRMEWGDWYVAQVQTVGGP
ncbi:MAG: serine protease [Nannocystaceae bacterium]